VTIYAFATAVQSGMVIGETSLVSFVLAAKFNWADDGESLVKNSYITNIGIIGIGIGALVGSKVIQVVQ
jgi:hypothetical protein